MPPQKKRSDGSSVESRSRSASGDGQGGTNEKGISGRHGDLANEMWKTTLFET